jgi:iron complex outermembrane receptor protein
MTLRPVTISRAALACALAFGGGIAHAAEAAPAADDAGTIVVTGFANTIKSAANLKRRASAQIDSILATDIAAFPDTNLAESIQRVPGVAITRDAGGEGRQVSLRGFTPDYTLVRLNGMPTLSTSGSIDSRGGQSNSRSFDFNIFASELFNRIDVRKSAEASIEEGGIGGTVDLFTARALDFAKPRLAASAQGIYNEFSKKTKPRLAGLASWRNEEGTLGALVSVAYSEREVVEKGFSTVRWAPALTTPVAKFASSIDPALVTRLRENGSNADALYYPRYLRYDAYDWKQSRLGVTGALQYHPSKDLQFDLDLLYGRLKDVRDEYHLDSNTLSTSAGINNITVNSLTATGNNVTGASFSNAWVRSDTGRFNSNNAIYQGSLGAKARLTDRLTMDALAGYNFAKFTVTQQEFYYTHGDKNNTSGGTNVSYDFSQNANIPVMGYGIDVTNPASFGFFDMRLLNWNIVHDNATAKLNFHYDINPALKLHVGGFANRQMIHYTSTQQIDVTTGVANSDPATALTSLPFNFASGMGVAGLPTSWAVANLSKDISAMNAGGYAMPIDTSSTFRVIETVAGGYAQLDFSTPFLGATLRGNGGVRVVNTHVSSQGYVSGLWTAEGNSYLDILPSLNAVLDIDKNWVVRLNADRNISRPTLGNLSISGGSVNQQLATISKGNPNLKPFRADSLSVSAEYYFKPRTMVAVAPFFKYLEDTIISGFDYKSFAQTGLPASLLNTAATTNTMDTVFTIATSINGGHATAKGVELSGSAAFDFLPGLLANTGLLANYTFADGTQGYTNSAVSPTRSFNATLVGLTKHSANVTLYYTANKLDARLSYAFHGKYLTGVNLNGNDIIGMDAAAHVDASLRYNITKNAALTFDALNLTNSGDSLYVGNVADGSHRVYSYLKSGRSFMFGARITL